MDNRRNIIAVGLICVLALSLTRAVFGAQSYGSGKVYWQPDGVPFCLAHGLQGMPHVTTDDADSLIAVWADCRPSPTGCDIYAQRVGEDGDVLWQVDGAPVSTVPGDQLGPRIASDGVGGALITWSDFRNGTNYSVYAQRLDSMGNRLWGNDGITITIGTRNQTVLEMASDALGGAFVVWEEWQGYPDNDVNLFAQRIDNRGNLLWSTPVTITAAPNEQYYGDSASDGAGGFVVTWSDLRDTANPNIYAQRISASGVILWTPDGVLVSPDPALQRPGYIVGDGTGGAYIAWYDFRSNAHRADVYMQRLTPIGTRAWEFDLPVIANYDHAEGPNDLISDGNRGVILIASRYIDGAVETDILAQRVNSAGELLWGTEPVNVTPWETQQDFAVAVPDGEGGAYIAWIDKYTDKSGYDIWTQHLGANGARLWPGHGVQAVGAAGSQEQPVVVSDGHDSFIVAWQDYRNNRSNPDLYAQRIGDLVTITRYFLPLVQKTAVERP